MTGMLLFYCVFAGLVLIWCSLPVQRKCLNYVVISAQLLKDWSCHRTDLIIIELRPTARDLTADALNVLPGQLNDLLRWIPPHTTLVLCGKQESEHCRGQIEATLLRVGIETVYVLQEDAGPYLVPKSPELARA